MRFRLRRPHATFYDLFAQMASHLVDGADLLEAMLEDSEDRPAIARQMREAESQCDETTHAIIRQVNSTFVTPFDREDIYRFASLMDDVMDFMEQAVDLIDLYEVGELPAGCADQVEVLQRAASLTVEAMPQLQTMGDLEAYWIEINRLEKQADRSYRRILVDLFGGSYRSLEVLKLKDIVDSLEQAVDAFESVANTVEQIVVKES